jgi:hypothetical protein
VKKQRKEQRETEYEGDESHTGSFFVFLESKEMCI